MCPILPLFTLAELDSYVAELKGILEQDKREDVQGALQRWRDASAPGIQLGGLWFQRIAIEKLGFTTSSDHAHYNGDNPGPLNTLWGRLSAVEGTLLRPLPKWAYLRAILPSMEGKSVMEIGSACGFWPFKFASMGARFCSGIEVVPELFAQAQSVTAIDARENVHFALTDAYLDPSVPPHDIVFMSEVLVHSIFPDFSLLRALNLAKECLIIDDFFRRDPATPAALHLLQDYRTGKISWTAFALSEVLIFQLLYMYGVEPSRVTRYHDPLGDHTVLVIDTRGVAEFRQARIGHASLFSSVQASMENRGYEESLRGNRAAHMAPSWP